VANSTWRAISGVDLTGVTQYVSPCATVPFYRFAAFLRGCGAARPTANVVLASSIRNHSDPSAIPTYRIPMRETP